VTAIASDKQILLVTGGAGFIGSNLVDALIALGYPVRILDNFENGKSGNLNPKADLITADIRHADAIRAAFDGVDTVFHVAALPRIPLSIADPVRTHMTNVVGTLNVLVASRDAGVRRVIYSGSSSVYGMQPAMPLRETMAPNPLNPYALQKSVGEQYTRMFHRFFDLQTLTLRYFNVYGPRMTFDGAYVTVIAAFIEARKRGLPLTIHGDGGQTRDFTHVSDVVEANIQAMHASTGDGRAINIGAGHNVSVNRIAALIGGPIVRGESRPGDMRDTLADISEAANVLGWRPKVAIEDGLAALLKEHGLS